MRMFGKKKLGFESADINYKCMIFLQNAETERDELQEELTQYTSKVTLSVDEKKRLEVRISTLEEELEEEQSNVEVRVLCHVSPPYMNLV